MRDLTINLLAIVGGTVATVAFGLLVMWFATRSRKMD